ncbi:MAG: hypothetical protein RIE56_00240, partial [Amphiplicatus sp.]
MPITSSVEKPKAGHIRTYRPDSRFECGPLQAIRALLRETVVFRSHIKMLFLSEFRNAYRGTALGIFWNFALPIVPITVYILLVNLRVLPEYDGMSPAVYIGFNFTLWQLLTGFLRQPIQIVKSRNATMMMTAMPLSAAIVSSFAQLFFDTLARLGFLICMIALLQNWPALTAPLAFAALLCGLIFCLGLGLALAILNAVYPD